MNSSTGDLPSVLFSPYAQRSPQRSQTIQNRVVPIPILFYERRSEGDHLGVPVLSACAGNVKLVQGDYEPELLKHRTTLKLKFSVRPPSCSLASLLITCSISDQWPNYAASERQIRGTAKSPMHNLDRLAKLAAGAVRNFMAVGCIIA